jgi:NAD(P)-dependent dehydrogenase (short-subunit alcohol dehydrogenase family)
MQLEGNVAIVTGASRGVGAATAIALAQHGCRVACAARATDAAPLPIPGTIDDTVHRIEEAGGEAIAVATNLAHDDEIDAMVATTIATFGRVDILVNNAAITFPGDLELPMAMTSERASWDLPLPVWMKEQEKSYLVAKLNECGGRIDSTAKKCGIDVRSLHRKMRFYGLDKKSYQKLPPKNGK